MAVILTLSANEREGICFSNQPHDKLGLHPDRSEGWESTNLNQPFQSTNESPLYLPFHHATRLSKISSLSHITRPLPRTHNPRDRLPRAVQRRQIQSAEHALRLEAGTRLLHARTNTRHQLLLHHRLAAAPATANVFRRSPRLRLR